MHEVTGRYVCCEAQGLEYICIPFSLKGTAVIQNSVITNDSKVGLVTIGSHLRQSFTGLTQE